ncbi:MAG: hypothetical protein LBM20_07060 [Rikenellaceae bacterium]|jgi:hypothetical protein|nr:hypothetical protein [Rikenellaceae bacterium]
MMVKRFTFSLLVALAAVSVVIGSVVPHHHHHGREAQVCFANDQTDDQADASPGCCDGVHHAADGSCCGVKTNLVAPFDDSRRDEIACDCDGDHLFHGGHFGLLLALSAENRWAESLPAKGARFDYPSYSPRFHSLLIASHFGLRAPPCA